MEIVKAEPRCERASFVSVENPKLDLIWLFYPTFGAFLTLVNFAAVSGKVYSHSGVLSIGA